MEKNECQWHNVCNAGQCPCETTTTTTIENTNRTTGNPFKTGTRKTAENSKLSGNPHANSDTPEIKKPSTEGFPEHPSKPNCTPAQQQRNKIYN